MTDEMIMEAVKSGDLQQATVLFERYNRRIFSFLARMTLDRDAAEDLTQNVFLRVIKYRTSYREGARFQSWIFQIARNVFSDHYQSVRNKFSDFVDVSRLGDALPDTSGAEENEEREDRLHRSLARLTAEQREVLVLTRFEQLKYEEVATMMNITVANVKVKVHRAILRLREFYFEMEGREATR